MEHQLKKGLIAIGFVIVLIALYLILSHSHNGNIKDNDITHLQQVILGIALFVGGLGLIHYNFNHLIIRICLLAALYSMVGWGISHVTERLDQITSYNQQRLTAFKQVSDLHSRIESAIWADLNLSNAMIGILQASDYEFDQPVFENLAAIIVNNSPRVRHVAIAEDMTVTHVYPLKGNEKAIGLNYRTNAQQLPIVQKSIDEDAMILAGPVNLVQGGTALIARIPLWKLPKTGGEKEYWGLMSLIIVTQTLFEPLLDVASELNVAIRGKDATGSSGGNVFGNPEVFASNPVTQKIRLPYGEWQMAVAPVSGWIMESPNAIMIRTSVAILWLVIMTFTLARGYQHLQISRSITSLKDELVDSERKTDEISEENRSQLQAHKLEAIGQLTGGIAHDFNNILAAITGYAQLSQMVLETSKDTDKLNSHIAEIVKAGERAKELVKQMLTFSRGRDVRAVVIEPMTMLQETLQMMHALLPASIRLETHYTDFDSHIKIDPVQLQQILINLVVNARDAIPSSKGKIVIGTELMESFEGFCDSCNESFTGDYLCLSIQDDGQGIAKDKISKIFDPFYTTKEVGKGTGMGLSVVHGILHGVNGHIIIDSKLNHGTTINLLFEVTTEPLPEDFRDFNLPDTNTLVRNQTKKVLIIDDETTITELYEDVLETKGITSIVFNDPELGLDFFKQHHDDIAVIITDYTMPRMSGTDLVKAVRRQHSSVPIILCSGNADVIDRDVFEKLMINHFLTKPVDLNNLSNTVSQYL